MKIVKAKSAKPLDRKPAGLKNKKNEEKINSRYVYSKNKKNANKSVRTNFPLSLKTVNVETMYLLDLNCVIKKQQ